jgi:hypothetical protein
MWKPVAGENVLPLPVTRVASRDYFNVQMITTATSQEEPTMKGFSNCDSGLELSGILYMPLCRRLLMKADGEFFDFKEQPSRTVLGTRSCTVSPTQPLQSPAFSILK